MGRVDGKVALVAGAGGGIGGAGAEGLAREGAAVLCADLGGAAAEATAARIRAAGARAAARAPAVLDREQVEAAIADAVGEIRRLDILLESVGISHRGNFLDVARARAAFGKPAGAEHLRLKEHASLIG